MDNLQDVAAERLVLAGVFNYGANAYYEIADFLNADSFTENDNLAIYNCLRIMIEDKKMVTIDRPSFNVVAKELGYNHLNTNLQERRYIDAIQSTKLEFDSVRTWAAKIRKLQISRLLYQRLGDAQVKLGDVTGNEPIEQIVGIAENTVLDFTQLLYTGENNDTELIGNSVLDYIKHKEENPCTVIGIGTGYKYYDKYIGYGLRRKTVGLIGARMKVGKSQMAINIGLNVAQNNIPVLYLDTEMGKEDHIPRMLANLCYDKKIRIQIDDIEMGKFTDKLIHQQAVREAGKKLSEIPFHYMSVAGKPFEEMVSIMRRWIMKHVGYDENGRMKDCLIMYDYIKLMSSDPLKNMQEFQALGFLTTTLHNFAVRYDIPVLAFTQLNRDGIDKESTDVIAGSDRVLWLVTHFTIFKRKSPEEIAADGPQNGNRKMVVLVARHGEGMDYGNYINMNMFGQYGKIIELDTKANADANAKQQQQQDEEDDIPFNPDDQDSGQ